MSGEDRGQKHPGPERKVGRKTRASERLLDAVDFEIERDRVDGETIERWIDEAYETAVQAESSGLELRDRALDPEGDAYGCLDIDGLEDYVSRARKVADELENRFYSEEASGSSRLSAVELADEVERRIYSRIEHIYSCWSGD